MTNSASPSSPMPDPLQRSSTSRGRSQHHHQRHQPHHQRRPRRHTPRHPQTRRQHRVRRPPPRGPRRQPLIAVKPSIPLHHHIVTALDKPDRWPRSTGWVEFGRAEHRLHRRPRRRCRAQPHRWGRGRRLRRAYRRNPPEWEVASWRNSRRGDGRGGRAGRVRHHGFVVELELSLTSYRLDCMLTGVDRDGRRQAIVMGTEAVGGAAVADRRLGEGQARWT